MFLDSHIKKFLSKTIWVDTPDIQVIQIDIQLLGKVIQVGHSRISSPKLPSTGSWLGSWLRDNSASLLECSSHHGYGLKTIAHRRSITSRENNRSRTFVVHMRCSWLKSISFCELAGLVQVFEDAHIVATCFVVASKSAMSCEFHREVLNQDSSR